MTSSHSNNNSSNNEAASAQPAVITATETESATHIPTTCKSILTVKTIDESLSRSYSSLPSSLPQENDKTTSFERTNTDSVRTTTNTKPTQISFDKIFIREHPITCGDNPSVSSGPPLQLDWPSITHQPISIDDYESIRIDERRIQMQMKIPKDIRKDLLVFHGSSLKDIEDCSKKAKVDKKKRMHTNVKTDIFPHLDENMEKITRALTKPFRKK